IFLTWQNIRRQRELVDQHLLLSAGSVLHGVEANLMRIMHTLGGSPDLHRRLFPTIKDVFQEITASGDIVFLGVFDEDGTLMVSSSKESQTEAIALPEQIIAELEVNGRWAGPLSYHGKTALFAALRARPSLSRICSDAAQGFPALPPRFHPGNAERGLGFGAGRGLGRGMGRSMGLPPVPDLPGPARQPDVPSLFLVAALSPDRHLAQFNAYRRAALLQTGYVLAAAAVLWFLSLAYLNRRNQALKAARLERFQSKLLDNMPDGLLTLGADGLILSANGSAARLLLGEAGGEAQGGADLTGRNFRDFPFAELAATDGSPPEEWRQYAHDGRILEVLCLPLQTEGAAGPDQPEAPSEAQSEAEERLVLLRDRTRMKSLEDD
ncbi:MAG: ATPase, partial [Desulfovibrio sp.]|nr:ATPase [Desulfovibrio sp.]